MKLPVILDASAHAARESADFVQEQADGSAWAEADQHEQAVRREAGKNIYKVFMQAMAEKFFNPFARLHPKERYEGTVLGLSLCKKIIERHHGTITASGVLHQGATFTIRLPRQQRVKLV